MVSCSVLDCTITNRNNPNKETFHRFPKNALVKEKWIRMLNRPGWEPHKTSIVCSRHFKDNCFLKRNQRRVLMKESIPTEFVPVKLKLKRPVSSYIYRDIEETAILPPQPLIPKSDMISKLTKLKQKLKRKQQEIRNLRAKTKRLETQCIRNEAIIEELQKRTHIKDNFNDINAVCNGETLRELVERGCVSSFVIIP